MEESFVRTACGRNRYNVLGALNFCGKKVTTVTNDAYISAEQVVTLMGRMLAEYKDKALALVLNNAAYQRRGKVTEYAKEHGAGVWGQRPQRGVAGQSLAEGVA